MTLQLVTGASGFVGQHLVRFLSAQGSKVRALYNSTPPGKELQQLPGITWQQCDLLDVYDVEAAMHDVQDVYHCAGIVSFNRKDKESLLHFNVESTANIVNEALEQGIRKMLFMSSVAALGKNNKPGSEVTEEIPWEESGHYTVYGASKYMAEMEVWRGMAEGLNAVIINPSTILGTGDWDKGSARLIKVVYGEFPFYTDGVTGWVDVKDVVNAAYALMQSEVCNERFIVSAGNHAFKDIFTAMATEMGRKPPHIRAGRLASGLVWRWNEFRSNILGSKVTVTKETAHTAQRKTYYNNEKLGRFLPGFSYRPIKQTIAEMAQAFIKTKQ